MVSESHMEMIRQKMHIESTSYSAPYSIFYFFHHCINLRSLSEQISLFAKFLSESALILIPSSHGMLFPLFGGESEVDDITRDIEHRYVEVDLQILHVKVIENYFALQFVVENNIPLVER